MARLPVVEDATGVPELSSYFRERNAQSLSAWLVNARAPDLQAATCNSLNAVLAPAAGFGK